MGAVGNLSPGNGVKLRPVGSGSWEPGRAGDGPPPGRSCGESTDCLAVRRPGPQPYRHPELSGLQAVSSREAIPEPLGRPVAPRPWARPWSVLTPWLCICPGAGARGQSGRGCTPRGPGPEPGGGEPHGWAVLMHFHDHGERCVSTRCPGRPCLVCLDSAPGILLLD